MKFRIKRSTWVALGLVLLAVLPIIFSTLVPSDSPIKSAISGFVESPYYLFALFVLYLVIISVMSRDGGRASRERSKANEALATIDLQYRNGDTPAVIRDCKQQLSTYPNDAALHWYLALATYAEKDFQVARPHFLKAAEIDPRFESAAKPFLEKIVSEISLESIGQQHLH